MAHSARPVDPGQEAGEVGRQQPMTDVFTPEKRSQVMAAIRGRHNRQTELRLIAIMRAARITGWRRNFPLPGKPDFVFPKARLVVFTDGCFWHGCPRHGRTPGSNVDYWIAKLTRNKARDREVTRQLKARRWRVLRLWACALREPARVVRRLRAGLEPAPRPG